MAPRSSPRSNWPVPGTSAEARGAIHDGAGCVESAVMAWAGGVQGAGRRRSARVAEDWAVAVWPLSASAAETSATQRAPLKRGESEVGTQAEVDGVLQRRRFEENPGKVHGELPEAKAQSHRRTRALGVKERIPRPDPDDLAVGQLHPH